MTTKCSPITTTNNVTGSPRAKADASGWLQSAVTKTGIVLRLFFIVECGIVCFLWAVHVFEVQASSPFPRLPLRQILFLSWPPLLS